MCKNRSLIKISSEVPVGTVACSLAMCVRWVLPFVQARALISPERFSVRNIKEVSAFRCLSLENVDGSRGLKHLRVWNWVSLLVTASLPRFENSLSPALRLYCFFFGLIS